MIPTYQCQNCDTLAAGSSDIAPGPPDFCDGCSVGHDRPQPGDWREIDPATVAEYQKEGS